MGRLMEHQIEQKRAYGYWMEGLVWHELTDFKTPVGVTRHASMNSKGHDATWNNIDSCYFHWTDRFFDPSRYFLRKYLENISTNTETINDFLNSCWV